MPLPGDLPPNPYGQTAPFPPPSPYLPPGQVSPPTYAGPLGFGQLLPHRGGLVLALGIVSLVLNFSCGIGWVLGIVAWVMGNADLRAMDQGRMDPTGRGSTQAGRICGIISIALVVLGVVIYLVIFVLGIALFAAGAGAAGGAGSGAGTGGP